MKKYKPSAYNLVVDSQKDGKKLIFNTLTSAFCLLDSEGQQLLSNVQHVPIQSSSEQSSLIEQLGSLGFLVDHNLDEFALLELRNRLVRYGNRRLTLTIGPTLDCNMCCPYCFESKKKIPMTPETADKLISFLTEYIESKSINSVNVSWYGGEPLLEMDIIERISNGLISFCEKNDVAYSASIVTNGYLLSRDYAKRLKNVKVHHAQITIDGLENTHNKRRKLKDGTGSFWPIIHNIESTKDILNISIRINVDENNMKEIDLLSDFFINEMKWGRNPSFYLAPVERYTDTCGADPEKCLQPNAFSQLRKKTCSAFFKMDC